MKSKPKQITLRIPADLLERFRPVCRQNMRSINGQLLQYIRKAVRRFEEEHGVADDADGSESGESVQ